MAVDPLAPWEGLAVSEQFDPHAIMVGGTKPSVFALTLNELLPDDRAGLDVLYPSVPEPAPLGLGASALGLLAARRRLRRRGVWTGS